MNQKAKEWCLELGSKVEMEGASGTTLRVEMMDEIEQRRRWEGECGIKMVHSEIGIRLLTSTPYCTHNNGRVEAANKVIIGLIKKRVEIKPKN